MLQVSPHWPSWREDKGILVTATQRGTVGKISSK